MADSTPTITASLEVLALHADHLAQDTGLLNTLYQQGTLSSTEETIAASDLRAAVDAILKVLDTTSGIKAMMRQSGAAG